MNGRHCLRASARWSYKFSFMCVGTAVLVLALSVPSASETVFSEPVVRVEEDWMLVLNEPDDELIAPQFHTVMSPFGDVDSVFAQVTWNYREVPDFAAGGLQMYGWSQDWLLDERAFAYGTLSRVAETIRWTQTLSVDESVSSFSLTNGYSSTWGAFGYPAQNMKMHGVLNVANLNGYSPRVSVENSGVSYGANRVGSLRITQVRYYGKDGLLGVDLYPRVVVENMQGDLQD